MKKFIIIWFLFFTTTGFSQNIIEWDGIYKLKLSDFQSPATQIGDVSMYSLHSASTIDFAFHMTNAEFMFTKNFNSKVNCSFRRDAAVIVATDSIMALQLLDFARYEFDLSEVNARKFRQQLYEKKGAFSDANFFRPVFDKIQKEYIERHAIAAKETDIGRNSEKLSVLQSMVLVELEQLADFCKTCKPIKKKK